jgi:hypothetical protein
MTGQATPGQWAITTDHTAIGAVDPARPSIQVACLGSGSTSNDSHDESLTNAQLMAMSKELVQSLKAVVEDFKWFTQLDKYLPPRVVRAQELLAQVEPLLPELSNELTGRQQHAINADDSKEP